MRRQTLIGLGASFVLAVCGCSGGDTGAGSSVAQPKGGSGGTGGGEAGSLNLGLGGGGAGTGGGGAGGGAGTAGAGVAGASGGMNQGGSAGSAVGGSSSGGSGGSKPAGMCKRSSGSDADCADFDPTTPQAYACDDPIVYSMLNGMHGGKCYSVNFIAGSKYGACCPP